jgi:hypothetical protein
MEDYGVDIVLRFIVLGPPHYLLYFNLLSKIGEQSE